MSIEHTQEKNLRQDISEARQFLTLLDEDSDHFVFETIQEPKPKDGPAQIRRHTGTFEALEQTLIDANQNGNGVFVTINETDGNGRKNENVTRVRSFFVDLDGSPLEPVLQSSLEPHIIVESSPGRYHAYWFVEDVPLDKFESIQKLLASQFGGDPSVCDLPRIMRLPGFLHQKKAPYRSRIINSAGTLPYQFQELCRSFQLKLESKEVISSVAENCATEADTVTLGKLRELGLIKRLENVQEGRWLIRCPWTDEHSNGDDAYYFSKPSQKYSGEGFKCFHTHCRYRDIRALRFYLGLTPVEGVEPLPLFRELPPSIPFPVESLGKILGDAAVEIHQTIKAPLAVIAQSLLGAASLVTQGHANVEIDGRVIALSLFLITVAESGERKSAVDDVVLSAVFDWQASLWAVYREERREYERKLEEWQNAKKRRNSIPSEETEQLDEPVPPIMPIIIVEEPTYEGLVKYLEYGQPSVGLFSDEGGRFLGGNAMNRDNLLKTLAGLSSIWDAKPNKPITRMRSGDKSLALYGRRGALHLMIQESIYSTLSHNPIYECQGFLPRSLISFPESTAGTRKYVKANPKMCPSVTKFRECCNNLLDRKFPVAEPPAPQNQLAPPAIQLSIEARKRWVEFHDAVESKLGPGGVYHAIRRFGSKAAEHVLRVAGVFAVFENPYTKEVEISHVDRATTVISYYLEELLRLHSYCSIDPKLMIAQKVLDWALSKRKTGVSLKELYQRGPADVRSRDKALAILKVLEDHGRAFPIPANELVNGEKGKAWRFIWPIES